MSGKDVDLSLDDIEATLNLNGLDNIGIDVGLDDVNAQLGAQLNADTKLDLNLGEIRANADVKADLDLDVGEIKADAKLDADLGLDDIKAQIGASGDLVAAIKELAPVFLNLLWKEIPIVKVGMPHRYKLAFNLLGSEIWSFTLMGESEFVSESNECPEDGDA
ncbi:MAG: hypothetical protein QNK03_18145 [Myxococcota bacterium]|nr:hypothetical protein [Myxococcota bacterium]